MIHIPNSAIQPVRFLMSLTVSLLLIGLFSVVALVQPALGQEKTRPESAGQQEGTLAYDPGTRTVIESERGFYFGYPYYANRNNPLPSPDWANVGLYIGKRHPDTFAIMQPNAIKGVHGRLTHFAPRDDTDGYAYFPFEQFRQYDEAERAAGRTPLFVTATYQGEQRPVYWEYWRDLGPRMVNVSDERFVQFFVNEYVNQRLRVPGIQNQWVGLDECIFGYNLTGVFDDDGNFVTGVRWDQPFPQNNAEWMDSIAAAVRRIKQVDPSIKLICNEGNSPDEQKYRAIMQEIDGVLMEEFLKPDYPDPWSGVQIARTFDRLQSVNRNKVQVFQPRVSNTSDQQRIRTVYAGYLIMAGPNAFIGALDGSNFELPPEDFQAIKTALGAPIADPTFTEEPNKPYDGYRLYQRRFANGTAYLNWSTVRKTITFPSDQEVYNHAGNRITSLTLDHKEGDYVTFGSSSTPPTPTPMPTPTPPINYGTAPVFWRNASDGRNMVWFMQNGSPVATADLPQVPDTSWRMARAGDFNGDGKIDILWRNVDTGYTHIWYMNGSQVGGFEAVYQVTEPDWYIVGAGDVDDDGYTDILWRNMADGTNVVWFMRGITIDAIVALDTVAELNWSVVGLGDMDRDGKTDIVWHNPSIGGTAIWLLNGGRNPATLTSGYEFIPWQGNRNLRPVALGDYNDDGSLDVFWRDGSTGSNTIWLMNGTRKQDEQSINDPLVADLNWQVLSTELVTFRSLNIPPEGATVPEMMNIKDPGEAMSVKPPAGSMDLTARLFLPFIRR